MFSLVEKSAIFKAIFVTSNNLQELYDILDKGADTFNITRNEDGILEISIVIFDTEIEKGDSYTVRQYGYILLDRYDNILGVVKDKAILDERYIVISQNQSINNQSIL